MAEEYVFREDNMIMLKEGGKGRRPMPPFSSGVSISDIWK